MIMLRQALCFLGIGLSLFTEARGQQEIKELPRGLAEFEKGLLSTYTPPDVSGSTIPASVLRGTSFRTMAEWEELQAVVITWAGQQVILAEIVRSIQDECLVVIVCNNEATVKSYLAGKGVDWTKNVSFLTGAYNSVWVRDYGPNSVYANDVDSLYLVDWIYNRPRPSDDKVPGLVGLHLGLPVVSMASKPNDLVHTGGNFMSDGLGTGFSSNLVLEENGPGSQWALTVKDELAIDGLMSSVMGIDPYIKMENLPYDGIHHIDMHMKLLDESTLLVAEYPTNTADGPQINANISYVLSNFTTRWGTPFDVIRIPSPPEPGQGYPNAGGWYMTYTNSVFVNNTVLVPTYYTQYDTTALRIYAEALPGYNVVGIDCDSNAEPIIAASGAIHCITHSVGVEDPLIISHLPLPDTDNSTDPYPVDVYLSHRSGIAQASVWWTLDPVGGVWTEAPLAPGTVTDTWSGAIPAAAPGSTVYYYAHATATSGKTGARPMPAPDGWWSFDVSAPSLVSGSRPAAAFEAPYPNPASAITCVPVSLPTAARGRLTCRDVRGTTVAVLHEGHFASGTTNHFIDAAPLASGAYVLVLELDGSAPVVQRLMVR